MKKTDFKQKSKAQKERTIMECNQLFNKAEFDPLTPSCLFDTPSLPPVLDHIYSSTWMPDSDPPPLTTNQEDYFLTNQDWWHVYDFPPEPRFDTPSTDPGLNTVHNSESMILEGYYSKKDQERCDLRLEGVINGYDELDMDCPFSELLKRMAAPITKISASAESDEVKATIKPRKKRNSWTDEEHKLFLEGIKVYGHGDWINISRDFVKTRTNTQLASHAQKHDLRQQKKKRRGKADVIKDWNDVPGPN